MTSKKGQKSWPFALRHVIFDSINCQIKILASLKTLLESLATPLLARMWKRGKMPLMN